MHSVIFIYLALLLRNDKLFHTLTTRVLQNIDCVKMLYVNSRNVCHCWCFLFRFSCCFLLFFLLIAFYHVICYGVKISNSKMIQARAVVTPALLARWRCGYACPAGANGSVSAWSYNYNSMRQCHDTRWLR